MKTKITNFSPRFDINQPLAKWLSGESRSKLIASRRIAGIAKLVVLAITLLATSLVAAHSVEHGNHQHAVKPLTKANPDTQKVENLVRDYSLTGDDNLLKQGWAQITPRLHAGKTSAEDLLNAAWLAQADHEFHRALGFTESVLTLQPNNAQAWLLKSSIHTVLNESEQALQACQQLSLSLSIVAASACAAQNTSSQAEKAAAYSTFHI